MVVSIVHVTKEGWSHDAEDATNPVLDGRPVPRIFTPIS